MEAETIAREAAPARREQYVTPSLATGARSSEDFRAVFAAEQARLIDLIVRIPGYAANDDLSPTDTMTDDFFTRSMEPVQSSPDLARAIDRLEYLCGLEDGWLGEDSCAASPETHKQAESLLRRLAVERPDRPLPVLGLDSDGTIVMTWAADQFAGSLTVYGDGTYSYFVRRGDKVAKSPEERISQPIKNDLIKLLAA